MTTNKPLILVSNDDGIYAHGMAVLVDQLSGIADIVVVAPDVVRSGGSASLTSNIPLKPIELPSKKGVRYFKLNGTPVDCVKLGLNVICKDRQPDLVVAGINHGRNDAICVFYSGTVGAATEACIAGIPAIAISLNNHDDDADMTQAGKLALHIVKHLLRYPLPLHTMLNLNIPQEKIKGLKICPQGVCRFVNEYAERTDANNKNVYWTTGHMVFTSKQTDTDFEYLEKGYATLTPLMLDRTDYSSMDLLQKELAPLF